MMKLPLSALALTLAVAGCTQTTAGAKTDDAALLAQVPPDHRVQMAAMVKQRAKDPYSIRDGEISAPSVAMIGFSRAAIVCASFNGKNSFGAYIGKKPSIFVFRDGKLVDWVEETGIYCGPETPYQPFPEINGTG